MTPYVFVPSNTEHPTKNELELLLQHLNHDFKGIAHSIIGCADMLSYDDLEQGEREHWYNIIVSHAQHFSYIANALTTLGKKSNPKEFFMGDVIKVLKDFWRAEEKTFLQEHFPPEDLLCQGYPAVVYLQLFNWALNAQESYGDALEKRVEITVESLGLSPEEHSYLGKNSCFYDPDDNHFVKVSVSDFGCGIPAEKLPAIFQPEFTTKPHGSGLGLALTDYICDLLHGFVKVESEAGKGSGFSLYFAQNRG